MNIYVFKRCQGFQGLGLGLRIGFVLGVGVRVGGWGELGFGLGL